MIRTAKNISLILVVALLIISTGGYSIFHHVCHCAGEMTASVFLEPACEHDNSGKACCHSTESHSCCMEKDKETDRHACHDGDCCETDSQFIKIHDSYQPVTANIILKPFVTESELFLFDFLPEKETNLFLPVYINDLPPPQTGKQIVVAQHQLKLDQPLV